MLEVSERKGKGLDQKPTRRALGRFRVLIVTAAVSLSTLFGPIGSMSRTMSRAEATPTTDHASVTLLDEVEHLPAPAWKSIPVVLPYTGSVTVDVRVSRGNPIDVFLTAPNQLEKIKRGEWSKLKISGGVRGSHTRLYTHSGPLSRGGYYLVIGDTYLGEPPSPPTEVSLKVRLQP